MSATLEQAIQSMDSATAALIAARQDLEGKNAAIDASVAAQQAAFAAWKTQKSLSESYVRINANAEMTTYSGGAGQQLPAGMGVYAGGDFFTKFETEIIPVANGVAANTRPQVAQELLDYMGNNVVHLVYGICILRVTVKANAAGIASYSFTAPFQHMPVGQVMSYCAYHKQVGSGTWNYAGAVKGAWSHNVTHHGPGAPLAYDHIDYAISNPIVGDTLYLALPQIVTGRWPADKKPPFFVSIN